MAIALASLLLVLGQAGVASAAGDNTKTPAKTSDTSAATKQALIDQALAQGLITKADLVAKPVSASAVSVAPAVTTLLPTGGPLDGGQIVAITGTAFTDATAVSFGSVSAAAFAVVSATRIVVRVPSSATAGAKVVAVTTAGGANTTGASYTYGAPTVTAVSPAFADPTVSKTITITGTGFLGAGTAQVSFAGTEAKDVFVVSDTSIVAISPIDDSAATPAVSITRGVGDVKVTRNSVDSATSTATKFLFSPGAPTITTLGTSLAPVTGTDGVAIGALMTITGTQLWGVNKVNFGSATAVTLAADIVVASDGNTMTVKVPSRTTAGPVDVTVESMAGVSTTNLHTRYSYIIVAVPTITAVTPNVLAAAASGGGGTFLVTGTSFTGLTTAKVTLKCTTDVVPTSLVVVSDTSLIVTAPGNVADKVEACGLEVVNPADSTKKATMANAVRYL